MKISYMALLLLLGITACSDSKNRTTKINPLENQDIISPKQKIPEVDFTHLLDQVGPSVVGVDSYYTNSPRDEFSNDREEDYSDEESNKGSGIILDQDGYIITNIHVVKGSNAIKVTLMDKRVYMAKVVGVDQLTDLALLKIKADHLVPIRVGDVKKLKVGQWVAALGAPFGFQFSLTSGIISAKKRTIPEDEANIPFLQTDAAINQGSSGGPLLNLEGEVIGVNAQIYSRTGGFVGIAFAIPIDIVINVANQLKTTGKVQRGQLGVKVDGMSYELAKTFGRPNSDGALVLDVLGGAAGEKKLKVGDIILVINGEPVKGPEDLPSILNLIPPGEKVEVYLWRAGHSLTIQLTLAPKEDFDRTRADLRFNDKQPQVNHEEEVHTVEGLDLGLKRANQQVLSYYHLNSGLQIVSIGRKAEGLGFMLGDIIVKVGENEISDQEDLEVALRRQKNVPVFLLRNNQPIFIPYTGALFQGEH
ncbi:MAG: trypsin-like peptidase domain-containing protein [Neisseriaceae bacterium]